uniref:Uncharacterized protein n=1 Tax=Arundo donax TaxID=35708 RepID=A0A0A9GK23_ARUDO
MASLLMPQIPDGYKHNLDHAKESLYVLAKNLDLF